MFPKGQSQLGKSTNFILNLYKIEISLSIRNDSEMSQICGVCSTTEVLAEPRLLLEPNEVASPARWLRCWRCEECYAHFIMLEEHYN